MSKKGAQEFWAKYGAGGVLDGGLWAHDSSLLLHCKARALVHTYWLCESYERGAMRLCPQTTVQVLSF